MTLFQLSKTYSVFLKDNFISFKSLQIETLSPKKFQRKYILN